MLSKLVYSCVTLAGGSLGQSVISRCQLCRDNADEHSLWSCHSKVFIAQLAFFVIVWVDCQLTSF